MKYIKNHFVLIRKSVNRACRNFRNLFPRPFKEPFNQYVRLGNVHKAFLIKHYLSMSLFFLFTSYYVIVWLPDILQTHTHPYLFVAKYILGLFTYGMTMFSSNQDFRFKYERHERARAYAKKRRSYEVT